MNPHQPVNPYIAGSPVTGTEMFYGREDVFTFIRRNLIGQHRDTPVVLYGQRRTGKTSVLYQLHRHLDASYRCVFIDLHGLNLRGTGNLLLGVANSISRSLRRDYQLTVAVPDRAVFLADPQPAFETTFLDAVWAALGDDHLVLMLDEVIRLDEEVKAGRLEPDIFNYLRHLMQHHARLNFVFSLGSGLEEMAKDYAFLFSVSLYHRISFLETGAARELITQPPRAHYQVAPQAVDKILQITSGHPYYTQLVCHCIFDLWSRSPKPALDVPDVDAVLAEAIELGSANLTYVWEDSTPGEKALMAGVAAAMQGVASPVTLDQVRNAWRDIGVSLPEPECIRALRSLMAREVIGGGQAYRFTVDLQRLWLEKHRRLPWVKEELTETVQRWNRSAEPWPSDTILVPSRGTEPARTDAAGDDRTGPVGTGTKKRRIGRHRGRYLAIAAAAVVLAAGYLTASAITKVAPFSSPSPAPSPTQSPSAQLLQLMPGDLPRNRHECRVDSPPSQWRMPGLVQAVRCTDPGLPGGNVYAYQLDSFTNFQADWQNFNQWWEFLSASAGKKCPPSGGATQGIVVSASNNYLPQGYSPSTECGWLGLSANKGVPAYAFSYPLNSTFIVAEGGSGSSFSALVSWLTNPTSPVPVRQSGPVASLTQLLPQDVLDPSTQCSVQTPPFSWSMPGLVQALTCNDPGVPNGYIYAFQMKSSADYDTAWANYNKWWGFTSSSAGSTCPPPGHDANAEGSTLWHSNAFPARTGQVLECEWVGQGRTANEPAYTWTYPTENTFIVAQGAANTTFAALDNWWTNNASPLPSPSPAPP